MKNTGNIRNKNNGKWFVSLKAKIMFATLIPIAMSFSFIYTVIFSSLFHSLYETAKAEFLKIGQEHAISFEGKMNQATDYLSIVSSTLELQVEMGTADRETLQQTIFHIFDDYGGIDGSSIYFEPNRYDGKDAEYVDSEYGTALSGRICYYFYKDEGRTAYLPEALEDEIEFELPHYTDAKEAGIPIYTKPTAYEVDGKTIPMFTITYPILDGDNQFIGAVTVDLFLEDIYTQIQNETIYETGYVVIANDNEEVIYSPRFEDIGRGREEIGFEYALPSKDETSVFFGAKSILNGKDTLIAIETIYVPQLDSCFYISVAAPIAEINAGGIRLITILVVFSVAIVVLIAVLLYYLIGRISAPIKEITENANRIANGDYNARISGDYTGEFAVVKDAVNTMADSIEETLELKLKKEKAEAAALAKNKFLARMSHEIRTPMNAVMGMTELILRKDLPPDIYENALMIKSASANLLTIINDILDFSKIESGMLEIVETDYQLPSLINDAIGIIRVRLIDKPLQFIVNVDPNVPAALTGDEVRIRQVLINLLSNAVKYSREGYIALRVTGEVDGDFAALTMEVSDSGIGIKKEDIGRLFGDFVRIDKTQNKGIEGTGLGLAIARNLCRAMGGDITVQSEYGKGSVFTVTLSQKVTSYVPFASIDEPGGKSVLLYETRQVYRDSIVKSLESLGVDYKSVESIPALFENLENYTYAFVSSFMYGSINPALSKLKHPPCVVLLADVTESIAPKDARVLALPAHALSIANIMNDIYEEYGRTIAFGASFQAPDAKVLVVDDVTANLKVAEGMLLPYEMQVTLCPSGREAITLVKNKQYDLVFMDHMMPDMDGLETTGHIRKLEGEYYESLPIIALTANAVSGVREMFIQNGMNDFLSKPIEMAKLDTILERWIPKEKQKKTKSANQVEEKSDFVDMLETVPEISVQEALSIVGGSADTYERIVRLSIRLLPENIARLNELIETSLPNYAIEVHGMKGVLNNIGAYELGAKAFELEELSKVGDWESCKALHPGFIDRLKAFTDFTEGLIGNTEVKDKVTGDMSFLLDVLHKLEEAVDYYDSTLAFELISSVKDHTFGVQFDQILEELTHAFERFDFEKAEELLTKLKGMVSMNG